MDIQQYAELSEKQEAAYLAFRRQYTLMKPEPVKPLAQARSDWLMRVFLLAVIIAGFVVSGSRTITVFSFGKSIGVGGAAVVMLEGAAIVFSFYYIREKYREGDVPKGYIAWYLRAGGLFAVLVMCSGNVQDVLSMDGFNNGSLWTVLTFPIAVSVALAAPLMVYISGHALALLSVLDASKDKRAEQEFIALQDGWQQSLIDAWNHSKLKQTVRVSVDIPDGRTADTVVPALSERTGADGQRTDSGHGYGRKDNAKEIVRAWLNEHPEDITAQVRELASRLNVGKSTVSDVQREFKA